MATYGQFDTLGPFTAAIGGGWKLYHYVPGTTTTKNLWSDRDKQNTVAQPLVADSNGVVSFYADGLYDFVVYDSNDVLKYTWDGVFYGSIESTNHSEGVALASASTLVLGDDGDYFHVTGTTAITAIQGTQPFVWLTFDSTLTLTHSSSLVLKGGVNHPTIAGETLVFVNDGANVFREVDNGVPMKYANNTWTGANVFSGTVELSSAVTFGSTATIQEPAGTTQIATKNYTDKRAADSTAMTNGYITATVGSNALTIALQTMAGSDPSATDVISVPFRAGTATNSSINVRSVTTALSMTISAGSTLGFSASQISRIYVVALDNAGTVELGVYHPLSGTTLIPLNESQFYSTTAEGGAGGADSAQVIYSTTARSTVPITVLGFVDIQTGGTAGNWSNSPIHIQLLTTSTPRSGSVIQRLVSADTAAANGTTVIPVDNSIPQSGEGTQFMSLAITPRHAADLLLITHVGQYASSVAGNDPITVALFQDSTANALAATASSKAVAGDMITIPLMYMMQAGTTSATTFKIRAGSEAAGTTYFNSENGGTRVFGGVAGSGLAITEIFI